jgi:hypothetical protein
LERATQEVVCGKGVEILVEAQCDEDVEEHANGGARAAGLERVECRERDSGALRDDAPWQAASQACVLKSLPEVRKASGDSRQEFRTNLWHNKVSPKAG